MNLCMQSQESVSSTQYPHSTYCMYAAHHSMQFIQYKILHIRTIIQSVEYIYSPYTINHSTCTHTHARTHPHPHRHTHTLLYIHIVQIVHIFCTAIYIVHTYMYSIQTHIHSPHTPHAARRRYIVHTVPYVQPPSRARTRTHTHTHTHTHTIYMYSLTYTYIYIVHTAPYVQPPSHTHTHTHHIHVQPDIYVRIHTCSTHSPIRTTPPPTHTHTLYTHHTCQNGLIDDPSIVVQPPSQAEVKGHLRKGRGDAREVE